MTQEQLRAEIQHLRLMQRRTVCNRCKRALALTIERREQHLRDRIKFDYLVADLQKRDIAVKVVEQFAYQNQSLEAHDA